MYAFGTALGAAGVEVYLKIFDGFERHAQLQVYGLVGRSRCGNRVVEEQPVVLPRLTDVVIARQSESKVKAR